MLQGAARDMECNNQARFPHKLLSLAKFVGQRIETRPTCAPNAVDEMIMHGDAYTFGSVRALILGHHPRNDLILLFYLLFTVFL
jgi:hypothetical protein